MDLQLTGKRALVTGSSSGIGASIARVLAREGASVVVHGRNAERTQRVADDITHAGGEAIIALGDLGRDEDATRIVKTAADALGGIDILINNAGSFPFSDWKSASAQQWVELYNQNVGSLVRLVVPLVSSMREQGWGRVINIATTGAINPPPFVPAYAASKGAVLTLTVSLSKELAKTGITVNTVSPGPIETEGVDIMMQAMGAADKDAARQKYREMWQSVLTVNRLGQPGDVAHAVAFLASPLADFITGANLRVDGGHVPTVN